MMNLVARGSTILILAATSTGCAIDSGITLAPGAAQVKITSNPADVSGCAAVGYTPGYPSTNGAFNASVEQNAAVGLNANVVFDTGWGGVAYRCNK
jgi:hypothetical protein